MEIIIAAIACFVIAAVGAWIVYLIFKKNGPTVGPFRFVRAVSERKDANMGKDQIKIRVGLPDKIGDVKEMELTVTRVETADGKLLAAEAFRTKEKEVEFWAVRDTGVTLSCVAIDDVGNRSEELAVFTFTVEDTISLKTPTGGFTIEAIDERPGVEAPAPSEDDKAETETDPADKGDPAPSTEDSAEASEADPAKTPETPTGD